MLAGAPVPVELILPIRRSLYNASPYYHHPQQQYQHLQPTMLQAGYWGRCAIDPEPGRCRRTDGKKWRCSREVVTGQKYCERHVHRGRNRSRKHVEIPTTTGSSGLKSTLPSPLGVTKEPHFTLSPSPSPTFDILPINQRSLDGKTANEYLPQGYCPSFTSPEMEGDKDDGRVLRKFFDDWPRTQEDLTASDGNASPVSTTQLSISIPGNSSDFSLKLSTGDDDNHILDSSNKEAVEGRVQPPTGSWSGWGSHGEASMGGPLAEALRSSTSTHSPTSVLHKPNGSASETSSAST